VRDESLFSFEQEFDEINQLIDTGKYYESLDFLNDILKKKKEITAEVRIQAKLLKSKAHYFLAIFEFKIDLFEQGLKFAEEAFLESEKINNKLLMFDASFWMKYSLLSLNKPGETLKQIEESEQLLEKLKSSHPSAFQLRKAQQLFWKAWEPQLIIAIGGDVTEGHLDATIQQVEQCLKLFEELEFNDGIIKSLIWMYYFYTKKADYNQSLIQIKRCAEILKETGNKPRLAYITHLVALAYYRKGELELFVETLNESRKLYEELGNKRALAGINNEFGIYYMEKGDLTKSSEYYEKALHFFQEAGEVNDYETVLLANIGINYISKGELDKALQYLNKSYESWIKLGNQGVGHGSLGNIIAVYILQGKLDEALDMAKKRLEHFKKKENRLVISTTLIQLGKIFWRKEMHEQALENFQQNLELIEEIGNKILIAISLHTLIIFSAEIGNLFNAKKYFKQLRDINKEMKNPNIDQLCRLSEAIVLKFSTDVRDKIKAELLLEQILEEELAYFLDLQTILLNLCELFMGELKRTNNPKVLEKLHNCIDRLHDLAISNNSFLLIAEILLLNSQLSLISLDFEKAQKLLIEAEKIAKEKGLKRLELKISKEKEQLIDQFSNLKNIGEAPSDISKRMEAINIEKSITEIKKISKTEVRLEVIEDYKKLFSFKI